MVVLLKRSLAVLLLSFGFLLFGCCCAAAPAGPGYTPNPASPIGDIQQDLVSLLDSRGSPSIIARGVVALEMSCEYDQAQAYKSAAKSANYYAISQAERDRMESDCLKNRVSLTRLDVLSERSDVADDFAEVDLSYCFTSVQYPGGKCLQTTVNLVDEGGEWKVA